MKKTIRIHISGYIFNIEEDAYTILEEWLDKISRLYADEEGGDEIVSDIEMRVAELFQQENGTNGKVISADDVNKIIEIMGMPEEFEEEQQEASKSSEQKSGQQKKTTTGKKPWKKKRLYRDEDNNVLGGVCSGLGNYFDIDPIIIRIIFIAAVVFGGFGTLVYIILWIIVPKAETTAQKLEMKGEPVTISNIEKTIKEEFENVKTRIINSTKSENFQNLKKKFSEPVNSFVGILEKLFKGLSGLVGTVLIIAGILAIMALFGFIFKDALPNFFTINTNFFEWKPFLGLLPLSVSSTFVSVLIFLLVVIPFIMLVLFGTKALFGYKSGGKFIGYTGLTLWIVGIILASFVGVKVLENYSTSNNHVNQSKIIDSNTNTLYLKLGNEYDMRFDDPEYKLGNYNVIKNKESLKLYGKPTLNIIKSDDNETHLSFSYTANGKTKKEASVRAKKINYNWQKQDSTITFYPYFTVKGNNKLYKRNLQITLEIPEGKSVFIDTSLINLIYDIENVENIWDHDMVNKRWIMTKEGLTLFSKDQTKEEKIKQEDDQENIDSLNLEVDTIKVSNEISI